MSDTFDGTGVPVPPTPASQPDPHGAAALLLVESLLHELVARGGLSAGGAVDVVQAAIDTQIEISAERGDDAAAVPQPVVLLTAIAHSIAIDTADGLLDGHGGDGAATL